MLDPTPLPALADNYIWVLRRAGSRRVAVVDPGEAAPVLEHLSRSGLDLAAILLTHHHHDHVAGTDALVAATGAVVFGPGDPRIASARTVVSDGQRFAIPGLDITLEVLHVPGHTLSHVAYVGGGVLLCGDTLFSVGCGRLFEGTPAEMLASLERLAALDPALAVCPGHEYTLANCRFALAVEPGNAALALRAGECEARRRAGRPTLPSTLADERACNPFLRVREASLREGLARMACLPASADAVEAFATLRRLKDAHRA